MLSKTHLVLMTKKTELQCPLDKWLGYAPEPVKTYCSSI